MTGPGKLIVGLGRTGLSCARYFAARGERFAVTDSRQAPPGLDEFVREFPDHQLQLGGFMAETFRAAELLVVSPGVSLLTAEIVAARAAGVPVTGDVDIFSKATDRPVVAVTGSNGKSTVVALVAAILSEAKRNFALGGNFEGDDGRPVLDLLREPPKDVYVLELSSFQLETTDCLAAEVSTILNLSEDHMDRYTDMHAYLAAKQKIFCGSRQVVIHCDDPVTEPGTDTSARRWSYGLGTGAGLTFGLLAGGSKDGSEDYVTYQGAPLFPVSQLKLVGQHNVLNVLAALTLAHAAGVDEQTGSRAVQKFAGLPNRCQWIAKINGVDYYNDSKGTNVGATLAAVAGLGRNLAGRIVLIAGGMGKGADFQPLAAGLSFWVRTAVLIGVDGPRLAAALGSETPCVFAADMDAAVQAAAELAQSGDAVLLSPACASFDMFRDFRHRGEVFVESVRGLQ